MKRPTLGPSTITLTEMEDAATNRDPFFDHLFYEGVLSTGIYCRTTCSARRPLRKNVVYFLTRKEASAYGLRPCQRCKPDVQSSFETTVIRLKTPYGFTSPMDFLGRRVINGIEDASENHYARSLRVANRQVVISISPMRASSDLLVRFWGDTTKTNVSKMVTRIFGLEAPVKKMTRALAADPLIGKIVRGYPVLLLPNYPDFVEGIVRTIAGQLISIKAAQSIVARIVATFGEKLPKPIGKITHMFPTAEILGDLRERDLLETGLTKAKVVAIRTAARSIHEGRLDSYLLMNGKPQAVDRELQKIPGIGPWTSALIRMETLGDQDVIPFSDLGVRKALSKLTGVQRLSADQCKEIERRWQPYGSFGTLYLWKSLEILL